MEKGKSLLMHIFLFLTAIAIVFAGLTANSATIPVQCGGTSQDDAYCTKQGTNPNLSVNNVPQGGENGSHSYISSNNLAGDDIEVSVADDEAPARLLISINNYGANNNTIVNARSKKDEVNSAKTILVGDILGNVTVNNKGKDGESFSKICADRFLNGDYGTAKRDEFLDRRSLDPGLPSDRCTEEDVALLNDQLDCQSGHTYDPSITDVSNTVDVERLKFGYECTAQIATQKVCDYKVIHYHFYKNVPFSGYTYTSNFRSDQFGAGCDVAPENDFWNKIVIPYNFNNSGYSSWSSLLTWNRIKNIPINSSYVGRNWKFSTVHWCDTVNHFRNTGNNKGMISGLSTESPQSLDLNNPNFIRTYHTKYNYQNTVPYENACYNSSIPFTIADTGPIGQDPKVGFVKNYIQEEDIQYVEEGLTCGDIPQYNTHSTAYSESNTNGLFQYKQLGTETVSCSSSECTGVSRNTSNRDSQVEVISAKAPTSPDQINILVYDGNINAISGAGEAGVANDLNLQEEVKYCKAVRDASTDGVDSSYAKTPTVSLDRIEWIPLRPDNTSGSTTIVVPENNIKIFKKVDESVRFLVENQGANFFKQN